MASPDYDADDLWVYYGLWSAKDIERVSTLLKSLDVRFYTQETTESEERLQNWCAWDPTSPQPFVGYDLWIHEEDTEKVGFQIVNMFPERKFG